MTDWTDLVVAGARKRAEDKQRAAEARSAELDALEAEEESPEDKARREREAREAKAAAVYEAIAASVQRSAAARAKARPPMSEYDRQVAAQALGEGWDVYDGPPAA